MKTAKHPTYGETTIVCACGAIYPTARRSRNSASLSAPRAIRGGRAGRSGSRPPGERNIPAQVCAEQCPQLSTTPPVSASRVPPRADLAVGVRDR